MPAAPLVPEWVGVSVHPCMGKSLLPSTPKSSLLQCGLTSG